MKQPSLLSVAVLLAACTILKGPETPLTGEGEHARVGLVSDIETEGQLLRLTGGGWFSGIETEGELLAVTETELILKSQNGIAAISVRLLRGVVVTRYEINFKKQWERLSPYCRYPQGLALDGWRQLLDQAGQTDFIRVSRKARPNDPGNN